MLSCWVPLEDARARVCVCVCFDLSESDTSYGEQFIVKDGTCGQISVVSLCGL